MIKGDDPGDSQQKRDTQPVRMVPRHDAPESEFPNIVADVVAPKPKKGLKFKPTVPNPSGPQPNYGNGMYDVLSKALKEGEELAQQKEESLGNDLSAGGGERMNAGKLRMDLLPPEWPWALSDVLTKGVAKGYPERNWEKGMEWSTMMGCFERHVKKFQAGERYDGVFDLEKGTTGCHHLAMAAWNILALMSYDLREIGRDDLPRDITVRILDRVNAETSDMGETRDES